MAKQDKVEAMNKATPAERVAFLRQTLAMIRELEGELEWRWRAIDDIWGDMYPDRGWVEPPPSSDRLGWKIGDVGGALEEVYGALTRATGRRFSDIETSEIERRLAEAQAAR